MVPTKSFLVGVLSASMALVLIYQKDHMYNTLDLVLGHLLPFSAVERLQQHVILLAIRPQHKICAWASSQHQSLSDQWHNLSFPCTHLSISIALAHSRTGRGREREKQQRKIREDLLFTVMGIHTASQTA